MKTRFFVFAVVAAITFGMTVQAQSDNSYYLAQAWECLNSGNCDGAQRNYDVYKQMTGKLNSSLEEGIGRCKQEKSMSAKYIPQGYVDLGLPSGTLWKSSNEDGYFTHKDAVNLFGNKLPSSTQFDELKKNCTWEWYGSGYKVIGKNGNSIILPAAGSKDLKKKELVSVGKFGLYWTPETWRTDNEDAVCFQLSDSYSGGGCVRYPKKWCISVRLVYNQ